MSTSENDWIVESSNRALELLAVLGTDDADAVAARPKVFSNFMDSCDDPAKFHTMLHVLVWVAHCMRVSASGDTEPGIWTFEIHTPLGVMPVDHAPPSVRWVSRWLIASMNGDARAAADLWFGTQASDAEMREAVTMLCDSLLAFLTHSVREFLAAGRPLVMSEGGAR